MLPTNRSIDALVQGSRLGTVQYGIALDTEGLASLKSWLDSLGIAMPAQEDVAAACEQIRENLIDERLRLGGDCYLLPMFVLGFATFGAVVNSALSLPREGALATLALAVADLGLRVTREGVERLVDDVVEPTGPDEAGEPSVTHTDVLRWAHDLGQRIFELWDSAEQARADGLPDFSIDNVPSWSCFISYNHNDEAFAGALYEELREQGVRVWYAPEAIVAARLDEQIREAIWRQDKLVVVLSEASARSNWVRDECAWALAREAETASSILLPISIEPSLDVDAWLAEVLGERRAVLDFSRYQDPAQFDASVTALIRS